MKYFYLLILVLPFQLFAQSSMRRCTLLPITDSVGGAIGFKVFEDVEENLKKSNWCTYVSNAALIGVFSKYRENLAQYLKQKEVLKTVSEKLQVGSLIRVGIVNEINGVEVQLEVYGEDGEDLYFSEKSSLRTDDVVTISQSVKNWLEMYSKMIPYDAKINGILGDQITLDVGKGYPIQIGQTFVVKRPVKKKKHPLLKKIVDWEMSLLAEGKIFNISDNQALGMVKSYRTDTKLIAGDWVRLLPKKEEPLIQEVNKDNEDKEPGKLGILSIGLLASNSSVDSTNSSGSKRMSGNLLGFDFRAEGWITRDYFLAFEVARSVGKLSKASGSPSKSTINAQYGFSKVTAGYKYLPLGFFYGPQIDIYGGYASYLFDLQYSGSDGFGQSTISGLLMGVSTNVPINREYKFMAKADFIPFPKFADSDNIFTSPSSVSLIDLEVGIKYQYTPKMTLDGSLQTIAGKSRFSSNIKEISYHDNLKLKVGASFNF